MTNNLLSLPAELRLRIYDYVIPEVPLSEQRSQYVGLVYSSKQIRSETEPEVLKAMRDALNTYFNTARRGYIASITFDEFNSLHELENLVIHVHMDCERVTPRNEGFELKRTQRLLHVMDYRFNALTMNISSTARYAERVRRSTLWRLFGLRFACTPEKFPLPAIKMIRVDWRRASGYLAVKDEFQNSTWLLKIEEDGFWDYDEEKNEAGSIVAMIMKRRK
ncbi:hypothetical protein IQ06DRAFT_289382 [Phaeosphaeriaceae sp. SRC1lsM3a]|nr:hypothetical protein IQ06DRAFT_289382 [Stagonospora sp. SRC1lsM3a]